MTTNDIELPVYKNRNEVIFPKEIVQLRATFKDMSGNPTDLDAFPTVSIIQPSGIVSISTSVGVTKISTGVYNFNYSIPIEGPYGIYNDVWSGSINGFPIQSTFNFIVNFSQVQTMDFDGYTSLGSNVGYCFSQTAICNINKLLKYLKDTLRSSGKVKRTDANGNTIFIDCDIYSTDILVGYLMLSLSDFNQTPFFTNFTMEDTQFLDQFKDIIIKGARLYALSSQALLERGREFTITDNGIGFNPPSIADMLNTQYSTQLSNYYDHLKLIKDQFRPNPIGLGVFTVSTAARVPIIGMLRHRRSGRFF